MERKEAGVLVAVLLLLAFGTRKALQGQGGGAFIPWRLDDPPGTVVGSGQVTFPPYQTIGNGTKPETWWGAVTNFAGEVVNSMKGPTRGERNNNPGNIEKSAANSWQGQVPGDDPRYVTFDTPQNGIRALARVLANYRTRYGLDTLREILMRYAPPEENQTAAYMAAAAKWTGFNVDQVLPATHEAQVAVVKAIIRFENGRVVYPDDVISAAVRAAV